MEIRRTEATRSRPEGDRVIEAPYVFINIPEYVKLLKDEEAWRKFDRNGITVFKTDKLTSVLTCLKKGATLKDNDTGSLLQLQVIEGEVRISTSDGDAEIKSNEMIQFLSNVQHSVEALKDSVVLIQTVK